MIEEGFYYGGFANLAEVLSGAPDAASVVRGNGIYGVVFFYQTRYGVLVAAEIKGLPASQDKCKNPVFGFHIHGGESCSGNREDRFADAGAHYNPHACPHPFHAGDMPPLFGNNGYAAMVFLTDRFTVEEIEDKTVIIHSGADDFTTQPGGNSGAKLACGEIRHVNK